MPRGKPRNQQGEQYEAAPEQDTQPGAKEGEILHGHAPYPDLTDRPASEDIRTRLQHAGLQER